MQRNSFLIYVLILIISPYPLISRGYVTLTFDDGYQSHYETVFPLLKKYQMAATFYIGTDFLGKPGYLTEKQVFQLSERGYEIASHSVTHRNLKQLSVAEIKKELRESQLCLENLTQAPIDHFAPPFGFFNSIVLQLIGQIYQSSRTIVPGLNDIKLPTPFLIRSYVLFNHTSLKEIEGWIDEAIKKNKWLVLVYHQIDDSDEITSIRSPFFEDNLKVIQRKGVPVKSMGEFLEWLKFE